jgi:hypothetical protein
MNPNDTFNAASGGIRTRMPVLFHRYDQNLISCLAARD